MGRSQGVSTWNWTKLGPAVMPRRVRARCGTPGIFLSLSRSLSINRSTSLARCLSLPLSASRFISLLFSTINQQKQKHKTSERPGACFGENAEPCGRPAAQSGTNSSSMLFDVPLADAKEPGRKHRMCFGTKSCMGRSVAKYRVMLCHATDDGPNRPMLVGCARMLGDACPMSECDWSRHTSSAETKPHSAKSGRFRLGAMWAEFGLNSQHLHGQRAGPS